MDKPPDSPTVQVAYRRLLRTITIDGGHLRRMVPWTYSRRDLALASQPSSMNGSRRPDGDEDDEPLAKLFPYEYSLEDEVIESIERHHTAIAVRGFVASLPPRTRQVVRLMYWDGLTQAEVARHLGVTEAAVSRTLKRTYDRGRVELARLYAAISMA